MNVQRRGARVEANRSLTRDVFQLTLRPEEPTGQVFQSGQYLHLHCPGHPPKSFSIASSPRRPELLEFCLRKFRAGEVSPLLAEMEVGAWLEYSGPFGGFGLSPEASGHLFVGTGTGIAPLRSMVLDLLERDDSVPSLLVFGNRSLEDSFYLDFFTQLEAKHPRFRFVPCLTQPVAGGWAGEVGRVTEVLPRVVQQVAGWSAYICGRDEMIQDATSVLVALGFPPESCYREPFDLD